MKNFLFLLAILLCSCSANDEVDNLENIVTADYVTPPPPPEDEPDDDCGWGVWEDPEYDCGWSVGYDDWVRHYNQYAENECQTIRIINTGGSLSTISQTVNNSHYIMQQAKNANRNYYDNIWTYPDTPFFNGLRDGYLWTYGRQPLAENDPGADCD